MLFDGRLDETVKHTHKGTSFTKQFVILCHYMCTKKTRNERMFRSRQRCSPMTAHASSQHRHFWRKEKRRKHYNKQYLCQSQIRYSKLSIKFNRKVMCAISIVVFTRKVFTFTLSFISKGIHSIATLKFLCRPEIPMLITIYSHNTQSYGSDNTAHIIRILFCIILSTKELVVQMTTAFFSQVSIV